MATILFVTLPHNSHTVRHLKLLEPAKWDIHVFPSYDTEVNRAIRYITGYEPFPSLSTRQEVSFEIKSLVDYPKSALYYAHHKLISEKTRWRIHWLVDVINRIQPDLIHSQTIVESSKVVAAAKNIYESLYPDKEFPPWLISNWGTDLDFWRYTDSQFESIQKIIQNADYYMCECERDIAPALELGFKGEVLPVYPTGGGFDIAHLNTIKKDAEPTSKRKIILIKGYQNLVGRGTIALRALELNADLLKDYQIISFLTDESMKVLVEVFSTKTGIEVEMLPWTPHDEMLKLFSQARLYIGLSLADAISTSMLEAMAMGAFPIQSYTACTDEWVEDGKGVLLVPPEDTEAIAAAIRRALTDDVLVDEAQTLNAPVIENRLNNEELGPKLISIYEQILNRPV